MTVQIKRKVLIISEVAMVALNRYKIKFKGLIDRGDLLTGNRHCTGGYIIIAEFIKKKSNYNYFPLLSNLDNSSDMEKFK